MKAVKIKKNGGPEVLELKEITIEKPNENEVTIEHKAIGLNYIDTYHRSGLYPLPLPSGIGLEAAGKVDEVGSNVTEFNLAVSKNKKRHPSWVSLVIIYLIINSSQMQLTLSAFGHKYISE